MDPPTFSGSLVMTGGGTGGHYFPAVALAEGAQARWPDRPITFVGAQRGIEGRLLPRAPWPHLLLEVEGFAGRSPWKSVRSAWKLVLACRRLKAAWKRHRPWAVVATGGYGSAVGSALGAFIFGMSTEGVIYADWDPDWFQFFVGAMLLLATVVNTWIRMRAMRGK